MCLLGCCGLDLVQLLFQLLLLLPQLVKTFLFLPVLLFLNLSLLGGLLLVLCFLLLFSSLVLGSLGSSLFLFRGHTQLLQLLLKSLLGLSSLLVFLHLLLIHHHNNGFGRLLLRGRLFNRFLNLSATQRSQESHLGLLDFLVDLLSLVENPFVGVDEIGISGYSTNELNGLRDGVNVVINILHHLSTLILVDKVHRLLHNVLCQLHRSLQLLLALQFVFGVFIIFLDRLCGEQTNVINVYFVLFRFKELSKFFVHVGFLYVNVGLLRRLLFRHISFVGLFFVYRSFSIKLQNNVQNSRLIWWF